MKRRRDDAPGAELGRPASKRASLLHYFPALPGAPSPPKPDFAWFGLLPELRGEVRKHLDAWARCGLRGTCRRNWHEEGDHAALAFPAAWLNEAHIKCKGGYLHWVPTLLRAVHAEGWHTWDGVVDRVEFTVAVYVPSRDRRDSIGRFVSTHDLSIQPAEVRFALLAQKGREFGSLGVTLNIAADSRTKRRGRCTTTYRYERNAAGPPWRRVSIRDKACVSDLVKRCAANAIAIGPTWVKKLPSQAASLALVDAPQRDDD